jgi:hypothetical protein
MDIADRVSDLLERGGILSPPDPSRVVDGADSTASIAVSTAMRHTFGASVGIPGAVGNGRRRHTDDGTTGFHGGPRS